MKHKRKKLQRRGRLVAATGRETLRPNAANKTAAETRRTFQESIFAREREKS